MLADLTWFEEDVTTLDLNGVSLWEDVDGEEINTTTTKKKRRGWRNGKAHVNCSKEEETSDEEEANLLKCYTCGKEGHLQQKCGRVLCFKCGQRGHIRRDCPQKEQDGEANELLQDSEESTS